MYNKVILIGTVIQCQRIDGKDLTTQVTLETHNQKGGRSQHTCMAVKSLADVAYEMAAPSEFVKIEGALFYDADNRAKIYVHNLSRMEVNP